MPAKKSQKPTLIDGNELLYRFFQALIEIDEEIAVVVIKNLISTTSVWLPAETFQRMPVLVPWVVRDNSCRKKTTKNVNLPERWGAPDNEGFLRDDNSLINKIPKSLKIQGPKKSPLSGKYLDTGWTASHIWREIGTDVVANRDPRLNSFIPNLVWLPKQIAKLSDIDGGLVQAALKATSWNLYKSTVFTGNLKSSIDSVWSMLPLPSNEQIKEFEFIDLNFFEPTEKFYSARRDIFRSYITFIQDCTLQVPSKATNITRRYFEELPNLPVSVLCQVVEHVQSHTTFEYIPPLSGLTDPSQLTN
jgi:hypothetical protein